MVAIVFPLSYISIIASANTIYSYIPYEKGGGDYTECSSVHLTFNTNAMTSTGLSIAIPQELVALNKSNCLIMLDENSGFVILAATNGAAGGPEKWRERISRPLVYEVRREAITCIAERK
jgi:hypothetical protein